ncbi:FAD-dependent oxidoreductase [Sphingobacterium faecium]|uniref:FAD-dependent oxidoreductase n=1 Tax=Sphingobacterium faecium TaxID=34087 RepID=UPI0021B50E0F|nr:FAD-dependent oxidoreductase [Sphingobacterium faecium]UXD70880.1 FAD-dependent oxidoreductase [Sphingobacterium faecium]
MIKRDGKNTSLWQDLEDLEGYQQVPPSDQFDVIIVGAGITGITTALKLQAQGKKCLILEAHTVGFGTTAGTSAHLNTVLDTPYQTLISNFGKQQAILAAEAVQQALEQIAGFIERFQISCDFSRCDGYMYATQQDEEKELVETLEAINEVGIHAEFVDNIPGPMDFTRAIKFGGQGRFHPLKYLKALYAEFLKLGGHILENTKVIKIIDQEGFQRVETAGDKSYYADHVVYATHTPPGVHLLTFKLAPYRSYVMGIELADNESYPEDLIYDMQDPFHYFRKADYQDRQLLLVGGQDHKTGQHNNTDFNFTELESFVRNTYKVKEVVYKWSSQYYESTDGLPYIGYFPGKKNKRIFVATGYSGNGMIFGTLSAQIISDLIVHGKSTYEALFSPSRCKPIAGFSNFMTENIDVAKHLITDKLSVSKIHSYSEIAKGEGRIINFENRDIGLFKDDTGQLFAVDPVCKHAGCVVQWNSTERSWDCPCHGARYDPSGYLLTGPATAGLPVYEIEEDD